MVGIKYYRKLVLQKGIKGDMVLRSIGVPGGGGGGGTGGQVSPSSRVKMFFFFRVSVGLSESEKSYKKSVF